MQAEHPRLYIKSRLDSGADLLKLCSLTILLALFSIPIFNLNPALEIGDTVSGIFLAVAFELYFLVIFVLPPALGLMSLGYLASRKGSEKRIENAAYGYIAGFLSGLVLILLVTGTLALAGLIGVAVAGFVVGIALSFVSIKPAISRSQKAIGIISAAAFLAVIFLIYPSGLLRVNTPTESPPQVSFEGLRDRYQVGEELSFSVKLDGFWNDCGIFPQTEVLKSRDGGNTYDALIWLDRGTINDYSNPTCDQNPSNISKTRQIIGTPLKPLVLTDSGLYEVRSGGDDIQGTSHRFVVTLDPANH